MAKKKVSYRKILHQKLTLLQKNMGKMFFCRKTFWA